MTCDKCKPAVITLSFGVGTIVHESEQKRVQYAGHVELCPLHDGSIEKRLAEALKATNKVMASRDVGSMICQTSANNRLLSEYEARQG